MSFPMSFLVRIIELFTSLAARLLIRIKSFLKKQCTLIRISKTFSLLFSQILFEARIY